MNEALIIATVVQAVATLILVGVTWWYAKTTARVLAAMQKQAEAIRQQSYLIALAAEIQGRTALPERTWLEIAVQEMNQYRKKQWPEPPELEGGRDGTRSKSTPEATA